MREALAAWEPRVDVLEVSAELDPDDETHATVQLSYRVRRSNAQGKPLETGICVLPCASFEAGTQKVTPGATVDVTPKAKKPPLRCPATYLCRSAGSGVPIDICVKQ